MRKFFLETERLVFSHWEEGDLPLARQLWGEAEVTRYICASGVFSPGEIEARLRTEIDNNKKYGVQYCGAARNMKVNGGQNVTDNR